MFKRWFVRWKYTLCHPVRSLGKWLEFRWMKRRFPSFTAEEREVLKLPCGIWSEVTIHRGAKLTIGPGTFVYRLNIRNGACLIAPDTGAKIGSAHVGDKRPTS